jgi:hypothetical protein
VQVTATADDTERETLHTLCGVSRTVAQSHDFGGTERITRTTLDAVRLDHLAEQHYRPRTRTKTSTR